MNDYIFKVKNLTKAFGKKPATRAAVDRITLNLKKGEIFGLVGPNGAGKTTFLKMLAGLVRPDSGKINIFGKDITGLTETDRREIGFVAEEIGLYDFMTAREIVNFNSRFFPCWDWNRCRNYLERLNIPLSERIKNFSKGMKTQLALVITMIPLPRLLIMDEPLEGLDPIKRMEVIKLILEDFMSKEERAIIISSHYLGELERIADRIGFIKGGRLIKVARMEEMKTEEKRLRVVFQHEPPPGLFKQPGIKDIEREGKTGYLITVADNFEEIYNSLSRVPHFVLETYHRDLDDLFRDYASDNAFDYISDSVSGSGERSRQTADRYSSGKSGGDQDE